MRPLAITIVVSCLCLRLANGQSFSFPHSSSLDPTDIRTENGKITCLYRVSPRKAAATIFRKVFLDRDFFVVDSIDYTLPGSAELLTSYSNERYTVHVFTTNDKTGGMLTFLVCDKSGEVHSTFRKAPPDFVNCFPSKVKKINQIHLRFVDNESPDTLIIQTRMAKSSFTVPGKTVAWLTETGEPLWTMQGPDMTQLLTTGNHIYGVSTSYSGAYVTPVQTLHHIDKQTGKLVHSVAFFGGTGYRNIAIFTTNGEQVMAAGMEYPDKKGKSGQFYMTMYDLSLNKQLDRVDTAKYLSTKRLHPLGHAFDSEGNLFFIGEGWKLDYTGAIASSALGILLGAATGSYYMNTSPDQHITSIVMVKVSPAEGRVLNSYTFPIGLWNEFSRLMIDGSKVLIQNRSEALLYDCDQPGKAPAHYTSLSGHQAIILGPEGPITIRESKKSIALTGIDADAPRR